MRSGSILRAPVAAAALRAALAVGLALAPACGPVERDRTPPQLLRAERMLMGTRFHIQLVTSDPAAGREAMSAAFEEVARVEALLSEWQETSEISAVNRAAGRSPVAVGPELLEVVERSLEISELTGGAFDVTFAGCGRLWSFREPRIPSASELEACLTEVDYRRIELDPERGTLFLPRPSMRIGIAGIGKGFGVDRAAEVLESRGITDYTVEGGGDVRLRGRRLERPWRIGIAHPRRPGELWGRVHVDSGAIVTSGDYQLYFEVGDERFHHILEPSTGRPARRSASVTVIAPDATTADALATGLFVLGPDEGRRLAERLPRVEALILDPGLQSYRTSGFPPYDGPDELSAAPATRGE